MHLIVNICMKIIQTIIIFNIHNLSRIDVIFSIIWFNNEIISNTISYLERIKINYKIFLVILAYISQRYLITDAATTYVFMKYYLEFERCDVSFRSTLMVGLPQYILLIHE